MKNIFHLIKNPLQTLLFIGILPLFLAAKQNVPEPILPLNLENPQIPETLLESVLRDPLLVQNKESNSNTLESEIKELKKNLKKGKNEEASELWHNLFDAQTKLTYYFADLLSGKLTNQELTPESTEQKLKEARTNLLKYAARYRKITKDKTERGRMAYHLVVTRFWLKKSQDKDLSRLKKIVSAKRISLPLLQRAKFFIAWQDIIGTDIDLAKKSFSDLRNLTEIVPKEGSVAGHLALANYLVTSSTEGQKTAQAKKLILSHLQVACSMAANLPTKQLEGVLTYALFLWRKVEGQETAWHPPFKLKTMGDSSLVKAISERIALEDWKEGDYLSAEKKYRAISATFKKDPVLPQLDQRVIELEKLQYLKTNNPKPYEKSLQDLYKKYDPKTDLAKSLGKNAPEFRITIQQHYKELVDTEIARAKTSPKATVIDLAHNYSKLLESGEEKDAADEQVAKLYVTEKQYAKAVSIYKDLAQKSTVKKGKQYLAQAIIYQKIIAGWPDKPPWNSPPPKSPAAAREALLQLLYGVREKTKPNISWDIISHIGLLEISLSRQPKTVSLWLETLQADPKGSNAAQVAGYLVITNEKAKQWTVLEQTTRICMNKKITPFFKKAKLDVMDFFSLALFQTGKQAFEKKDYKLAIEKLLEFVKGFSSLSYHDQAMYTLAKAYQEDGQYHKTVEMLMSFANAHPASPLLKTALLEGEKLSRLMAYEQDSVFFCKRFLVAYPADPEASRIRRNLSDLLIGRQLYAEASSILEDAAKDKTVSNEEKVKSLVAMMRLEERYGSIKQMIWAAETLLKTPGLTDLNRARALITLGRNYSKSNKIPELKKIEANLTKTKNPNTQIQNMLGEMKFYLAEIASNGLGEELFEMTSIKDPTAKLREMHTKYQQIIKQYLQICEIGKNSFCGPAMYKLARLAEKLRANLQNIFVAETLDQKIIDRFEEEKKSILSFYTEQTKNSDKKAAQEIAFGNTHPEWVQLILWQSSLDHNFEEITEDTGQGFVQWSISQNKPSSKEE